MKWSTKHFGICERILILLLYMHVSGCVWMWTTGVVEWKFRLWFVILKCTVFENVWLIITFIMTEKFKQPLFKPNKTDTYFKHTKFQTKMIFVSENVIISRSLCFPHKTKYTREKFSVCGAFTFKRRPSWWNAESFSEGRQRQSTRTHT